MSKPHLEILALIVVLASVLSACGSQSRNGANDDAPLYTPSTDTHPCLGVSVAAPDVIELGTEATVRVDVNNRCDEATTYTSLGPPYSLQLVSGDDKVVWFAPSDPIPSVPVEYTVAANGTTPYDVPVTLSADNVRPGAYRMTANLYVDQTDPDATQYVKDLRLESEPQSVEVEP